MNAFSISNRGRRGYRRDPVSASTISGNNVFHSLYRNAGAKYRAEQVQFCSAESFADVRSGADRTMVLDQQEASACLKFDLGHIAFVAANLGQPLEFFPQGKRPWYTLHVVSPLAPVARIEHTVQSGLAECISERVNERDAQFRVGVGDEPVCLASQSPILCRPPHRYGSRFGDHEILLLEFVEMLPDIHRGQAQSSRYSGSVGLALRLEKFYDRPPSLAPTGFAQCTRHNF